MTSKLGVCVALLALLALSACGGDDGDASDTTAAVDAAAVADEAAPVDETVPSPDEEPTDVADGDGSVPPLECPAVDEVAAITGVDIARFSGPAAGDPTELSCQYSSDDPQFTTGTVVYVTLDPFDTGPIGFGTAVEDLGEWAEVDASEGVIYVGFGGGILEIGTYADLTDDQLVELVEATLAAGEAA